MSSIQPGSVLYPNTSISPNSLNKVEKGCILDALAGIHWQGQDCRFSDWRFLPNINLWRDYLPPEIEMQLHAKKTGEVIKYRYEADDLIENSQKEPLKTVAIKQFQPSEQCMSAVMPFLGRFYPKDFLNGVEGIYQGNKFPCRIAAIDEQSISVNLNHPLAGKTLDLEFRIEHVRPAGAERGGRCNDIPSLICDLGPGMQDRLPDRETDFRSAHAFTRLDESDDAEYFSIPDFEPFWDSCALQQVASLYNQLIPEHSKVLDLMAGAHSPLQESAIHPSHITCAGLNRQELEANPICQEIQIVNVNAQNPLAVFSNDAEFDVVLIHAAIEYVIQPDILIAEIARILKPGGRIIISFSNRSVTPRVIQIWKEIHEFERPGLVLSYLRHAQSFTHFNSFSLRGLFRPESDTLASQLLYSDPVYMVWADKIID